MLLSDWISWCNSQNIYRRSVLRPIVVCIIILSLLFIGNGPKEACALSMDEVRQRYEEAFDKQWSEAGRGEQRLFMRTIRSQEEQQADDRQENNSSAQKNTGAPKRTQI